VSRNGLVVASKVIKVTRISELVSDFHSKIPVTLASKVFCSMYEGGSVFPELRSNVLNHAFYVGALMMITV
jgi:hypothetical protein